MFTSQKWQFAGQVPSKRVLFDFMVSLKLIGAGEGSMPLSAAPYRASNCKMQEVNEINTCLLSVSVFLRSAYFVCVPRI